MNETEARKKVVALKGFYGHLLTYVLFIGALGVVNFMTYLRGAPEIWVVFPGALWGAAVLLHGVTVFVGFGRGKKWEEEKVRQLMGWSATQEELARLSERVETLLRIVSGDDRKDLNAEFEEIRNTLLEAKRAINYYKAPLDQPGEPSLDKRAMIKAVEKLEAVLTSRAFQHFEETAAAASDRKNQIQRG